MDVGVITDLTTKPEDLNTEQQSKNHIIKMTGITDCCKGHLKFWKTQLTKGRLTYFSLHILILHCLYKTKQTILYNKQRKLYSILHTFNMCQTTTVLVLYDRYVGSFILMFLLLKINM